MTEPNMIIEVTCPGGLPDTIPLVVDGKLFGLPSKASWKVGEIIELCIGPKEDQGEYRVIRVTETKLTLKKVSAGRTKGL